MPSSETISAGVDTPLAGDWQREIALAAYYRWLARGGAEGNELEDWYQAEREVRESGGKGSSAAKDR